MASCPGRSAARSTSRSGALLSRGRCERWRSVRSRFCEAALRAASRPGNENDVARPIHVVPAQAGTHNHRGHNFAGRFRKSLTPSASLPTVCMGPRFREDDGGMFVDVCAKIPNSNFKQPRLRVLAPPREFKLLVDLPFLRGDGAPNDAPW